MTPEREQEYREEAERLAQLPKAEQRQAVALIRAPADNSRVAKPTEKKPASVPMPWNGTCAD